MPRCFVKSVRFFAAVLSIVLFLDLAIVPACADGKTPPLFDALRGIEEDWVFSASPRLMQVRDARNRTLGLCLNVERFVPALRETQGWCIVALDPEGKVVSPVKAASGNLDPYYVSEVGAYIYTGYRYYTSIGADGSSYYQVRAVAVKWKKRWVWNPNITELMAEYTIRGDSAPYPQCLTWTEQGETLYNSQSVLVAEDAPTAGTTYSSFVERGPRAFPGWAHIEAELWSHIRCGDEGYSHTFYRLPPSTNA